MTAAAAAAAAAPIVPPHKRCKQASLAAGWPTAVASAACGISDIIAVEGGFRDYQDAVVVDVGCSGITGESRAGQGATVSNCRCNLMFWGGWTGRCLLQDRLKDVTVGIRGGGVRDRLGAAGQVLGWHSIFRDRFDVH